jgi:alkylation response protein AidB-like acyl-CoA dehydrogenase
MAVTISAGPSIPSVLDSLRTVAAVWAGQRAERQQRRDLDRADFDDLFKAGLLHMSVPVEYGGLWESQGKSIRSMAEMYRTVAHGDSSVALVASMHPAVLTGGWSKEVPPEYRDAWEEQKRWAFQTALDGCWWGTIASEPGSGGQISRTKAEARQDPTGAWRINGLKHFGSGTGMASFMFTPALPEGEQARDRFFLDMRGIPLDGSAGAKLIAPWQGHGMIATQSHMVLFEDFPAHRSACPQSVLGADGSLGLGNTLWCAVILGIVETAMAAAREEMGGRLPLRPFEQVEFTRAENEAWLVEQAYEGVIRSMEQDGGRAVLRGKMAIAELAESALQRLCRLVGGSAYTRYLPFGSWYEDVRALGFLRPPWALAFDRLHETDWPDKD